MPHMAQAVSAKMWYSGSAQTMFGNSTAGGCDSAGSGPGLGLQHVGDDVAVGQRGAFRDAGEPPVYCRKAMSDADKRGCG
jgi:hypothetical protein